MTVNEDAGTATFTVTLSAASGQTVGVNYSASTGTAEAGDFTLAAGSLSFAPGETTKGITVTINDDTVFENSESFTVALAGASNATISDGSGLGTIRDDGANIGGFSDDDRPSLAVSDVSVTEGTDGYATFTVSLSNPSDEAVSFNLGLATVSATVGTDTGATAALEVSTDGGTNWTNATSATTAAGATACWCGRRSPTTCSTRPWKPLP